MEESSAVIGRNIATTSKTIHHSAVADNFGSADRNKLHDGSGTHQCKQEGGVRRPMWFLGGEDDALQVCRHRLIVFGNESTFNG